MKINENVIFFDYLAIIYKFIFVFLYIREIIILIYLINNYIFMKLVK